MRLGFDAIGSIAVIKSPIGIKINDEKKLAKEIIVKNKNIKTVLKKIGKTSGAERVFKVKWIAGEKTSLALHKENGINLLVDIKKVFFTPRLANERLRIYNAVHKNESVLDMFAGVGPYSILIAKKAKKVVSVDINREAIKLLEKNIVANKINNIEPICGDALKVVPKIKSSFDRIIMNFPLDSYRFLKAAVDVAAKDAVIHLYTFIKAGDDQKTAVTSAIETAKSKIGKSVLIKEAAVNRAGEVAPYVLRICIDIKIHKTASNHNKVSNLVR